MKKEPRGFLRILQIVTMKKLTSLRLGFVEFLYAMIIM